MNVYEFSIARAYAQLLAESKIRKLTAKEKRTMSVLRAAAKRYESREKESAARKQPAVGHRIIEGLEQAVATAL